MNDFSELENQLRKLRPAQPSSDLTAKIERALGEPETSTATAGVLSSERRFHFDWLSIGLGLAAASALILFALLRLQAPSPKTPSVASTSPAPVISRDQLIPAGLTQVVYHTRDEGVHFPTNSEEPVRRVRSHTRETLQWRNPKTGASLKITYPKEQVSLLPVSGQ